MYKYNNWSDPVEAKIVKKYIYSKNKKLTTMDLKSFIKIIFCGNEECSRDFGHSSSNIFIKNFIESVSDDILRDILKVNYSLVLLSGNFEKNLLLEKNKEIVRELEMVIKVDEITKEIVEPKNKSSKSVIVSIDWYDLMEKAKTKYDYDWSIVDEILTEDYEDSESVRKIEKEYSFKSFADSNIFLLNMLSDFIVDKDANNFEYGDGYNAQRIFKSCIYPEIVKRGLDEFNKYSGIAYVDFFKEEFERSYEKLDNKNYGVKLEAFTEIVREGSSILPFEDNEGIEKLIIVSNDLIDDFLDNSDSYVMCYFKESLDLFKGSFDLFKITKNEKILNKLDNFSEFLMNLENTEFKKGDKKRIFNHKQHTIGWRVYKSILTEMDSDYSFLSEKYPNMFNEKIDKNIDINPAISTCIKVEVELSKLINYQNNKWNAQLDYSNIRKKLQSIFNLLEDKNTWLGMNIDDRKVTFMINPPLKEISDDVANELSNKMVLFLLTKNSLNDKLNKEELLDKLEAVIMSNSIKNQTNKPIKKLKF